MGLEITSVSVQYLILHFIYRDKFDKTLKLKLNALLSRSDTFLNDKILKLVQMLSGLFDSTHGHLVGFIIHSILPGDSLTRNCCQIVFDSAFNDVMNS